MKLCLALYIRQMHGNVVMRAIFISQYWHCFSILYVYTRMRDQIGRYAPTPYDGNVMRFSMVASLLPGKETES